MKNDHIAISIVLIAVGLALLPIWFGNFYGIGDIRDVYIPLEIFFQQEQLAGHLPTWNPDIAWGYPTIAAAQIGFFYPPLLLLRFLPISIYLPLLLGLHIVMTALGTYFLFRHLKRSSGASLLGAIAFSLGGFVTLHLTHLNIIFVIAWLPWQLLAIHIISQKKYISPPHLITIGLLVGLPFLIGQIQVPLLMALISLVWFLTHIQNQTHFFVRLRQVSIITIFAIGIAAVQLLPTAELARHSSRNSDAGFDTIRANQHSYPLYHLPTLVWPRFYGNDDSYWGKRLQIEYGFYFGAIPLALAALGLVGSFNKKTHRFWQWLMIITFLLALGGLSPFRLIGIEPSLWFFSAPARWLLFTSLAISYFVAVGADMVHENQRQMAKLFRWLVGLMIIVVILGNVILLVDKFMSGGIFAHHTLSFLNSASIAKIQSMMSSAHISSASLASPFTILTLLVSVLALIGTKNLHRHKILLGLVIFELTIYGVTTTPALPWIKILEPPIIIQNLPTSVTTKQARIYSIRDGGDTGAYFTNPDSRADSIKREQQRQLLVPLLSSQHGLAGIEWPASLTIAKQVMALESMRGPTGLNSDVAANLNVGAILEYVENNIQIQELTESPRAELLDPVSNQIITGTTSYYEMTPTKLLITVDSSRPAKLLVRDTWYPGWVAEVNNQATSITNEPNNFRSVLVPTGKSKIFMSYQPISIALGLAISSLTILGILGVLIVETKSTA